MNLDDFSTVVEDRRYIKPQVGLDESNAFIDNLRSTQQANTQEIAEDTYNLGTAVPSNLGGLGGAGSYFTSRYQTPQTNEVVANLKAAAQAQALSEALSNKVAQAKQRYNQAYRAAQKRARSSGGGGTTATTGGGITGDVIYETPGDEYTLRKKATEGAVNTGAGSGAAGSNIREYYLLGPNGRRIGMSTIGAGNNIVLDTEVQSFIGRDAVNNYIQGKIRNGYKLMRRDSNGKVWDISTGYHSLWNI